MKGGDDGETEKIQMPRRGGGEENTKTTICNYTTTTTDWLVDEADGRTDEQTTAATETCRHTDGHDRRTGRRRTYATD